MALPTCSIMLAVDVGRCINGGYAVFGCSNSTRPCLAMAAIIPPELVDTRYAGWDDGRYLRHELLLIDGAVQPSMEFGITAEQEDGHEHGSSPIMCEQRLPCL